MKLNDKYEKISDAIERTIQSMPEKPKRVKFCGTSPSFGCDNNPYIEHLEARIEILKKALEELLSS